ncbi:PQQ-dependent sugar dehydrogenase [Aquisphaera insulae]|uniref:PQQ-dependent sugar dehydrogenase n=1 Tax=Aquisphaera insulae TaxID=2712864 RepID=UPI0013EDCA3B|nr:PQQ-dependent sugar dehydrogenase [Aquisphaera insulae]
MPSTPLAGLRRFLVTLAPAVVAGMAALQAADDGKAPARPAWTTSRVTGSPEPPPPFRLVRAFPSLKFDHPLLIVRMPGSDRMVVGEQAGRLYSFRARPDGKAERFLDLPAEIRTVSQLAGAKEVEAVYGLAFHPDFARNRECFVCYTLRAADPANPNLKDGTRVSRFRVTSTDPPRIDPASEEILLTFLQGGHNGGDLHFGPDGKLYISTGDATNPNPPDALNTGQDISDLLSSILRIDVDRKDEGKAYAIPKDNPFVSMEGARGEVWAYGFRNPWRMSFDRGTGELFAGDVGWELWEMIHRVQKGGNYGWSAREGPQLIRSDQVGPTPIQPPLVELSHAVACSITGGVVYRGKAFPELVGAYVFGDWETRRLWAARFEGDRVREMPEIARPSIRIVAFGEERDGEILILDYDGGTIHALEREHESARNALFPTALSQTGLFASVKDHRPAEGVVPFVVNSRQWQDGATEEHWAAFPGLSPATLFPTPRPIPGAGQVSLHPYRLHFPKDAVLTRTISVAGRRVETQMLHFDGGDWRAYSYAWRDDQTDADLVPAEGGEKEVPDGGRRRTWTFPGRGQCMSCHNNQTDYTLAFLPEQLNRPGPDGRNQLVAMTESGFVRRVDEETKPLPPFDAASAGKEPRLADPADEREPLEARALAYLHANCGHCHCDHGGSSVPLRLKYPTPLPEMHALDVRPTRGDFGLPDARIVRPGDPYSSTLYFRMAKFGRDRMPHLGAERPDEAGLALIGRWIAGLSGKQATGPVVVPEASPSSPRSAQVLARKLGRGEIQGTARAEALAAATRLPQGAIRDLFEGFLPSDGKPRLGPNPRPRTILALEGDVGRGASLFWSAGVKCGECHRVGDRGTAVGPDLSAIGKARSRGDLLESLLEPSRRIEPLYAAYSVATRQGHALTGILVRRDASRLVLRDPLGKEISIEAADVEELRPSRASLMPEGQLSGLSAQEAADLLAYLSSLR